MTDFVLCIFTLIGSVYVLAIIFSLIHVFFSDWGKGYRSELTRGRGYGGRNGH